MIKKFFNYIFFASARDQKGQMLVLTIVFMFIGTLVIVSVLSLTGAALQTGLTFDKRANSLYSADAGIEDGKYRIAYNKLVNVIPTYKKYDFNTTWNYDIANTVNSNTINVSIKNLWIPKDIDTPSESSAKSIIQDAKLVVTGSSDLDTRECSIKITYVPEENDPQLTIDLIGVWLPPGFSYDTSRKGVLDEDDQAIYYSEPEMEYHQGNESIHWDFNSLTFESLPGVDAMMTAEITFPFTSITQAHNPPLPEDKPLSIGWVKTSGVTDIPYSWNADVRMFNITSVADGTQVDSYFAKNELRELSGTQSGDYYATGNTLMQNANYDSSYIRDTWLNEDHSSSATVSAIPSTGDVGAAFLYWTAWKADNFLEFCSDFTTNNWTTGSNNSWGLSSGYYRGIYTSGKTRNIDSKSVDVSNSISTRVSWDQKISSLSTITIFSDSCSNFYNWNQNNPCWSTVYYSKSSRFKAQWDTGGNRDITLITPLVPSNFGSYGTININWSMIDSGAFSSSEGLDCFYSTDNVNWTLIDSFRGSEISSSGLSCTIAEDDLPSSLYIKFSLVGSNSGIYFFMDNINISITPLYTTDDGLTLSVSNDGINFTDIQTFHANDPADVTTTLTTVKCFLPSAYLNNSGLSLFKIRFTLNGFGYTGSYYYLDNIRITAVQSSDFDSVYFNVDDQRVYFDGETPTIDLTETEKITADSTEYLFATGTAKGYSYACKKDVTALLRSFSQKAPDPDINYPGNGTYTVGNVNATLGIDGNSARGDQLAHAGWSLIIVYSSPETLGHQLILYDRFTYAEDTTDIDFDNDGLPGGAISGFIVPNRIQKSNGEWETKAASITCFAGEGDNWITGEFIALNAESSYWDTNLITDPPSTIPTYHKLWDGTTSTSNSSLSPNNVWNGLSTITSADGIDIDTFDISWDYNNNGYINDPDDKYTQGDLIHEGDNSAHLDIYTNSDNWNLVYIILSFRSKTTTGSSLSYLIQN